MKPKSLVLLALALGCGLAASIGISQVMDANSRRGGATLETAPIYVALHNINLGDPINAGMIALEEWPRDKVPQGSISKIEDLEGRRARTTIISGTPILEPQLLASGELADPVAAIPDGYRISTISVNAEKSAAGLLSPGDRVDIQLFVAANQRQGIMESKTRLILQNIRVFAVEQAVQRSAEGDESKSIPKTVSLLVLPQQASKIDLAQNLGELSLIPRNPNDEAASAFNEITASDLLGSGMSRNERANEQQRTEEPISPIASAPSPRDTFTMEIVEAAAVREMLFDAETEKPIRVEESTVPAATVSTGGGEEGEDASGADDSEEDYGDFPIDFEEE